MLLAVLVVLFTVVLTLGRTDFDGVLVGCRDGCFLLLQIKQTLQVEIAANTIEGQSSDMY